MFPDAAEPTEILHYVYLNAGFFPIDFPTETVVLCHYRKLKEKKERTPLQEGMWRTSGPQWVYSPI